jgi:hypothetical protein
VFRTVFTSCVTSSDIKLPPRGAQFRANTTCLIRARSAGQSRQSVSSISPRKNLYAGRKPSRNALFWGSLKENLITFDRNVSKKSLTTSDKSERQAIARTSRAVSASISLQDMVVLHPRYTADHQQGGNEFSICLGHQSSMRAVRGKTRASRPDEALFLARTVLAIAESREIFGERRLATVRDGIGLHTHGLIEFAGERVQTSEGVQIVW